MGSKLSFCSVDEFKTCSGSKKRRRGVEASRNAPSERNGDARRYDPNETDAFSSDLPRKEEREFRNGGKKNEFSYLRQKAAWRARSWHDGRGRRHELNRMSFFSSVRAPKRRNNWNGNVYNDGIHVTGINASLPTLAKKTASNDCKEHDEDDDDDDIPYAFFRSANLAFREEGESRDERKVWDRTLIGRRRRDDSEMAAGNAPHVAAGASSSSSTSSSLERDFAFEGFVEDDALTELVAALKSELFVGVVNGLTTPGWRRTWAGNTTSYADRPKSGCLTGVDPIPVILTRVYSATRIPY